MAASIPSGTVSVRMYRGILGDCFLLRHEEQGEEVKYILIDCGVLQGVSNARERMRDIVSDIRQTTGGTLDLLVVTHEHHDHLSGFQYEAESFKTFTVREFWLAWTEDPNDATAIELRRHFDKSRETVAALASHPAMQALGKDDGRIRSVLGLGAFLGLNNANRPTGASTLKMLKDLATPARTRYLQPGQVIRPTRIAGLKTYVLGPPRDTASLRRDAPRKGAAKEVYLSRQEDANALDLQLAQLDDTPICTEDLPFAAPHRRPLKNAAALNPKQYTLTQKLYYDPKAAARKIDDEWYSSAETLALKMDSDTNNTSLVLAFELPDGQVLLFPGDAQVGNWLSWSAQTYPKTPDPTPGPVVTADDILARVSLYKVGHHCSHNATLRELGLEKMTSPRLVAMIPVVTEVAVKNQWNMPYPDLYQALKQKTCTRVIIGDSVIEQERSTFEQNARALQPPTTVDYHPQGLWVEVRISFGQGAA